MLSSRLRRRVSCPKSNLQTHSTSLCVALQGVLVFRVAHIFISPGGWIDVILSFIPFFSLQM